MSDKSKEKKNAENGAETENAPKEPAAEEKAEKAAEAASEKTEDVKEEPKEEKAPEEAKAEPTEEEKLRAENAELRDKYLRLLAEFDNFRKRSAKERQEIYPEATANAVEAFLPLADNFERAATAETADEKYKAGVMMIYDQLSKAFQKLGVEEINRVGEVFDPALENAVSQVSDENLGENTVAQVYQKGYKLGNKVIRHAMVAVAN